MKWINVQDRLPQMPGNLFVDNEIMQRVSDPVLTYMPGGDVAIAVYCEEDGFCEAKYGDYLPNVTYWTELPGVPNE